MSNVINKCLIIVLGTEVCCKMASKIEKHASDVYPSPNALKVLRTVFTKADKLVVLLSLSKGWMETYVTQNPDLW